MKVVVFYCIHEARRTFHKLKSPLKTHNTSRRHQQVSCSRKNLPNHLDQKSNTFLYLSAGRYLFLYSFRFCFPSPPLRLFETPLRSFQLRLCHFTFLLRLFRSFTFEATTLLLFSCDSGSSFVDSVIVFCTFKAPSLQSGASIPTSRLCSPPSSHT